MKLVARGKSEQNQAAIDPWTVVHLGFGVAAGMLGIPLGITMVAAITYELAEQAFQRTGAGQSLFLISGPETVANSVVDLGAYGLGWYWAQRWSQR